MDRYTGGCGWQLKVFGTSHFVYNCCTYRKCKQHKPFKVDQSRGLCKYGWQL